MSNKREPPRDAAYLEALREVDALTPGSDPISKQNPEVLDVGDRDRIYVDGGYAYVIQKGVRALSIVDVSIPNCPVVVSVCALGRTSTDESLEVEPGAK